MTDDAPVPLEKGRAVIARRNPKMQMTVIERRADGLIDCDWNGMRRTFTEDDLYAP